MVISIFHYSEALAFFLVLFFFRRPQAGGGAQRLPVVVDGEIAHVQWHHAAHTLLVDKDGDGAALDAGAERNATTAGEAGVCEAFEHRGHPAGALAVAVVTARRDPMRRV